MTAYEVRIIDWSSDVCSSDLLHLIFDPDPDRVEPRGRTRFPGAEPYPCGQVLCAAAGAATVQAIADGRGLRPLFPDRAVFPRRRPARRSAAGRILPAQIGRAHV